MNLTIKKNANQSEISQSFEQFSEIILNGLLFIINGQSYRITDIEFYYHSLKHPDPTVHMNGPQIEAEKWYFHQHKNGTYKEGTYKGLDITFGNNVDYGGILIRGMENYNNPHDYIDGPCLVVNRILNLFDQRPNKVCQLVNIIKYIDIFNPMISLKKTNSLPKLKIYKTIRRGLPKKKKGHSDEILVQYILRPYRFFTRPLKIRL